MQVAAIARARVYLHCPDDLGTSWIAVPLAHAQRVPRIEPVRHDLGIAIGDVDQLAGAERYGQPVGLEVHFALAREHRERPVDVHGGEPERACDQLMG